MQHEPLSDEVERMGKAVVNAAYRVHKELGPGLLEHVYEVCLCHEIHKGGFSYVRQEPVPILYDGIKFDEALRLDIFIENLVVCEIKSVDVMHPVYMAQLLTYLKLTGTRLGYLINFNVPVIKDGLKRVIL